MFLGRVFRFNMSMVLIKQANTAGPQSYQPASRNSLPTQFYPVSPPPYLNGGPEEFLSWVIETKDATFSPKILRNWLESHLPNPVETVEEWLLEEE